MEEKKVTVGEAPEKADEKQIVRELIALAAEEKVEVSEEECQSALAELYPEGAIDDDRLAGVVGGMKIELKNNPEFVDSILRFIFRRKKDKGDGDETEGD